MLKESLPSFLRGAMRSIKDIGEQLVVKPVAGLLLRLSIPPNVITFSSLVFAFVAFFFYHRGIFWAGAIALLLCGLFDTFDGEIARRTERVTKLGGFLDSTIDRVNEFIIYFGLFFYYYGKENYVLIWILLAIFGSLMVSYTRARAEGLGISPRVGLFERFTRFLFLIIGSLFGPRIMIYILVILALGTIQTTLQRIIFVHHQTLNR